MTRQNEFGQPVGDPLDVDLPRPRPDRTAMHGQRVTLVPMDPVAHATGLELAFALDAEGRNWTYMPYGPFARESDLRLFLEQRCTGDDPLFYTVLDQLGEPVGWGSYLRIDPANGVIEVGNLAFSPRMQRTAAATEAMYLMMSRAFDELGYRRYEWKCDALNAPSRRAAARLGFVYEGTFRQAIHYKGRNRDTAWFAIIDKDWPRLKAGFQRWLDPDNFDARGRQKSPLTF